MKKAFTIHAIVLLCLFFWTGAICQVEIILSFEDIDVCDGGSTCVPLLVENFENVNSLSGTIEWDATVLEYTELRTDLPDFIPAANLNESLVSNGLLGFVWIDLTGLSPVSITDGNAVLEVCFDVIANDDYALSDIFLSDVLTEISASVQPSDPSSPAIGTIVHYEPGLLLVDKCDSEIAYDQVNIFLDGQAEVTITPDMVLLPGWNPADFVIDPTSVDTSDVGAGVAFGVDDGQGNTDFGVLKVCDTGGEILSCKKIICSIQPNGIATIPLDKACLDIDDSCTSLGWLSSFSNMTNDLSVLDFSCADADNPGGLVPGGYTVYLWTGNILVDSCTNLVQVLDGAGHCDNFSSTLACNDHINVSVNQSGCWADLSPQMALEGGPFNYSVMEIAPSRVFKGDEMIPYTVTDTSTGNTCWGTVTAEDMTPPVVVINDNLLPIGLLLDASGDIAEAKYFSDLVDNGSHDGDCSAVRIEPEFWTFDCSNIGMNTVTMQVWDDADCDGTPGSTSGDNVSEVSIEIEVVYDGDLELSCPDPVTINCSDDRKDLSLTGSATSTLCSAGINFTDLEGYDQNGDGDFNDDYIDAQGNTVSEEFRVACNNGTFTRVWHLANSSCNQQITVEFESDFGLDNIVWPMDLVSGCLNDEEDIDPIWESGACDLIGFTYEAETATDPISGSLLLLRHYRVINWCTFNPNDPSNPGVWAHTQTIILSESDDTMAPEVACSTLAASLENGQVEVLPSEIADATDQCTPEELLAYSFTDNNPGLSEVPMAFSHLDADDNNQIAVTVYVWDLVGNRSSCSGTIQLDPEDCSLDQVIWPLETLLIESDVFDLEFTPEELENEFGFDRNQVLPNTQFCTTLVVAFSDEVLEENNTYKDILRTWTVLDWLTAETLDFEQSLLIRNPAAFICDFLANDAPIGDCESGHTLEDDVEWPADIEIADHRITPMELLDFSDVSPNNVAPVFFNDPGAYTSEYVDFVYDLSQLPASIVIERAWTVEHRSVTQLTWNYSQLITIDITNFNNLVSVNTISNRPLPEVQVTSDEETDMKGLAIVDEMADLNLSYEDSAINGVNIKDAVLIQHHALGLVELNDYEQIAADINSDQDLDGIDVVEIVKLIIGIYEEFPQNETWNFFDREGEIAELDTKGNYLAIKTGDVDDTAVIMNQTDTYESGAIVYNDVVMNNGQSYSVPIKNQEAELLGWGIQLSFDINEENVLVDSISSETLSLVRFNVKDGKLEVLAGLNSEVSSIAGEVITIHLSAINNTTLAQSLVVAKDTPSYLLDEEYNLILLNGEIEGELVSGIHDLDGALINVYPNPASDYIYLEIPATYADDIHLSILDLSGKVVLNSSETKVDISALEPGLYLYSLRLGRNWLSDKLLIQK